jgi:hypothetical protein
VLVGVVNWLSTVHGVNNIKYVKMYISSQRQITVRFTGHSRTVGPQYGTCFISPFWRLEFGRGYKMFGKFVGSCQV